MIEEFKGYNYPYWFRDFTGILMLSFSAMIMKNKTEFVRNIYAFEGQNKISIEDNDEKRVVAEIESKPNRLLVMQGNLLHGGCKPRNHNFRIVLNINWVNHE